MTLRIVAVTEAALVAALVFASVDLVQDRNRTSAQGVVEAMAMPGTELRSMNCGQACWLAGVLDGMVREQTNGVAGKEQFLAAMMQLRMNGAALSEPVCSGGRTLAQVACELGRLMKVQRSGCRDASQQVASCLERLRKARASGATEEEVQALARQAVADGELAPGRPKAGELRQQMQGLVRDMVAGVRTAEVAGM